MAASSDSNNNGINGKRMAMVERQVNEELFIGKVVPKLVCKSDAHYSE